MPENFTHHQQRPDESGLRAADRDRDAIADVLREQHLAGRLETEEFQERLDRCYAAKTYAQLDELVADLPRQEQARSARRSLQWPALALVPLLIGAIALSRGHLLWLAIPAFFFFVRPLLWHSSGRRLSWSFAGCSFTKTPPRGSYL
jgi:hypothetical protein